MPAPFPHLFSPLRIGSVTLKNRIVIAAIAKGVDRDAGRERFFVPGKPAFRLEEKSPVLY